MLTIDANPILCRKPEAAQEELRQRTTLLRKTARRTVETKLQCRNCIKEITALPALEESLHVIARGNFPLWSIVPAVLALAAPATIDALHIATLGFSTSNVADLMDLLDRGQIKAVAIVASVFFERQNPREYCQMQEGLAARGQRIVALRSHAKVIAMGLTDGRRLAVESSANLRSCRNIEQITLVNSPDLYQFHRDWIDQVIQEGTK